MKKLLLALLLLSSIPLLAQSGSTGGVRAVGTRAVNDCVKFASQNTITSAGAACGSGGGGISGTLTSGKVPVATATTTVGDGHWTEASTLETLLSSVALLAGPALSNFDAATQANAFDVTSGEVAISGQSKSGLTFSAGVQGIAQGVGASGVYGVASDTQAGTGSSPYAIEGLSFLTTTANNPTGAPIAGGFFSTASPSVATTVGSADGVNAEVIVNGAGTVTTGSDFLALTPGVFGGGAFTNAYGFDSGNFAGVTGQTAAFHSVSQGSGATHYGILLEGTTHNDLGSGATKAGSYIAGTDNSAAGTIQLANASANAHTIWGSGATTSNTIQGFATVPTTGHIVTCTVTATTCLLTDGGAAGSGTVTSVGFTGGLISVANPTSTPAFTVAGTSGGIPYFSAASTWASSAALASGGVVLGGGAGATPATNTALTFSAPTLTVGLAGTSSGILALAGSTSGTATITAPATAGTVTNALAISNVITLPDGATATPAILINDVGLYRSTTTTWRMEFGGTDKLLFNSSSLQPVTNNNFQLGATGANYTHMYSYDFEVGQNTSGTDNGGKNLYSSITELITLSTSGLTTDSTANLLPANSIIDGVVARVTTTITTTTNWALGDATTSARFASANSTLTSGTTAVGMNHMQGSVTTDAAGPVQTAAAKLRITCTGSNPGAGAIRVTVFYHQFVPPTS